jgi:transcription factor TFIIIB component B''
MDSLASRNIRVGRLSNREKAMREIDWTAVRQRQREEDARPIQSKELREKADQLLLEEQPTHTDMPRIRLGADGQIEMIHASTTIDRDAQADEIIAGYEVQEEEDITKRITSKSFMKNNKRFPNDFLLPGQGKRWNADDTEQFYQGLRSFGTDFQMISHMFPGASRRSIKLKFTREERDNPDLVREALLGQSQIVSHWDEFMEVSQMDEARFADADRINRELAEEEAIMREQIDAAKAETKERKRQQFEAGMIDAEGNEINPDGTVVEKGKNKRKGKGKRVAFQEEAGVEVLGAIDEDERWGQE